MNWNYPRLVRRPERGGLSVFAKAFVAIISHRPGLWLLCGVKVSAAVRRRNIVVVFVVVAIIAATALTVPKEHRLVTVLAVWGAGHLIWGLYLAIAVHDRESGSQSACRK